MSALETRHVSVVHGFPVPWAQILETTGPRWLLLAALLPFVLVVAVRKPLRPLRAEVVLLHLGIFAIISLAHAAIITWTTGLENPVAYLFPLSARLARSLYSAMPIVVPMYGAVLAAAWAMEEARERERRSIRASQLEAQLRSAELAALRAKLQPHFLYNTLQGIAALVTDMQPSQAVVAIERLSDLLHASLRDDGRDEVPVREEVQLAERYLGLQQMRFGERLKYELTVAPEVADCLVPVLLLQPLVENAVVHGLDAGQERLRVTVAAEPSADGIELRVENDGPAPVADASSNGHGVGIAATRARVATAYGERGSLTLLPRPGGGATVRVMLPRSRA